MPDDEGPEQTGPEQKGPGGTDPDPLDLARDIADRFRKGVPDGPRPQQRRRRPAPPKPGRRRSRDEPITLSDALGALIREQGWSADLDAQRVLGDWAGLVGPEVAQHSEVVGFAESVVHVRTDSTAWATQLRLLAPRIVAKLNEQLGDGTVLRIDIKGPQAPSWRSGPRSVKGRGPRDTYG